MPTNTDTLYYRCRSGVRNLVLNTLGTFKKPKPGIHILNGHRIQKEAEPQTFRDLLKALSEKVEFVRFEKAVSMIVNQEKPSKPFVAFSFDDGFIECYDIFAPVLEEFDTNAIFFINPNYVEGNEAYINHFNEDIVLTHDRVPMRWQHLRELSQRGFLIGAHTMDHYMINNGSTETLTYQIVTCKKIIEENTGKACEYFAFPYGKLSEANQEAIDIACHTYKYVFSQSDYRNYFSFDGKVINRRHFEPFWPAKHLNYFLGCNKKY